MLDESLIWFRFRNLFSLEANGVDKLNLNYLLECRECLETTG